MITIIHAQEELDNKISIIPMIGNIYYDDNMEYVSIDWDKEYIEIKDSLGHITVERKIKD